LFKTILYLLTDQLPVWQGFRDLFQTFEGLDDVKYIDEDIKAVEDLMTDDENES